MYGSNSGLTGPTAVGLAVTGMNSIALGLLAFTIVFVGIVIIRLVRRARVNRKRN